MFKSILFFLVLLSFNSFAVNENVDTKDGYVYGEYNSKQLSWLRAIQEEFGDSNMMVKPALNCPNGDCFLLCGDLKYKDILLLLMSSTQELTFYTYYKKNGGFNMIESRGTCSLHNFVPMIEY